MLFDNIVLIPIIELVSLSISETDRPLVDRLTVAGIVTVAWASVTHCPSPTRVPVISFALFKSAT